MVDMAPERRLPEEPLFSLGRTVATRGVVESVNEEDLYEAFARHERGDWGIMPQEDAAMNDHAVRNGGRLVSKWRDRGGTDFYLITEADRSSTTALLPSEY